MGTPENKTKLPSPDDFFRVQANYFCDGCYFEHPDRLCTDMGDYQELGSKVTEKLGGCANHIYVLKPSTDE